MDKSLLYQTLESLKKKLIWLSSGFLVAVKYSYMERKPTNPILIPFNTDADLGDLEKQYASTLKEFSFMQLLVEYETPVILRFSGRGKANLIPSDTSIRSIIAIETIIDSNLVNSDGYSRTLAEALANNLVRHKIVKKEDCNALLIEKIDNNLQITVLHGWPNERNEILILPIYYRKSPKPVIGVVSLNLSTRPSNAIDSDVAPGEIYADIIDFIIPSIGRYFVGPHMTELETLAQNRGIRAARAAVFARNFSHITGSHVISNPEFRNSLAGQHLVHSLRRSLDESYADFIHAENDLIKFITQGPNRAKNLWEQGTKALADARDKLVSGDVMLENTRRFHEYLQGRFDFIARAIDDTKDPPEPVWFVKDLIEGFLSQTAYLDNFVADVGLRLENMEFRVKIGNDEYIAQWVHAQKDGEKRSYSFTPDLPFEIEWMLADPEKNEKPISERDCMIALPGGMVAAHAFYSLLENIIRNSAKYGAFKSKRNNEFKLAIELKHEKGAGNNGEGSSYYHLRIWDNYSSALKLVGEQKSDKDTKTNASDVSDASDQPWRQLNEKLKKTFVKDNGQPETDDLGMMEMQACSQLLYNPDQKNLRAGYQEIKETQNEKLQYPLTYELNIAMPTLLGCLTDKETVTTSLSLYTDDFKRLCRQTPFLLVIDGMWFDKKPEPSPQERLRKMLEEARESLPTRVLLLYPNSSPLSHQRNLRISVCQDEVLYKTIVNDGCNDGNQKDLILRAYRAWLLNWKPLPDGKPWDLWIGLERQASQVREAWEHVNNDKITDEETRKLVRIMVKSRDSGFSTSSVEECYGNKQGDRRETAQGYWAAEYDRPISYKRVLLFDNHGNCFPEAYQFEKSGSLNESTRFYQKLSGSVSPDLFRMLSRPPKDQFSFLFFLYSLVESCLTNVAVVDERLAWSLVEGYGVNESKNDFAQDLLAHQKAGVFPVFRFRQSENPKSQDNNVGFYTTVHADRLRDCLGLRSDDDSFLEDEGIQYLAGKPGQTSGGSRIGLLTPCNSESTDQSGTAGKAKPNESKGYICLSGIKGENKDKDVEIDVLLIHEGAMDILASQMGVDWKNVGHEDHENQLKALYELAPIIIRTSGRGRKSKLLGEHLPFIEFRQVSSSLLTARNKFALVRGLLGSVGSERADGNP